MKILVDLKPALDGYAGIPQESRLLLKGLNQIDAFDVEGLIQHGERRLRPALLVNTVLSPDKRIDRLSKFVVSLYEKPYDNLYQAAMGRIQTSFARQILRLRANLGLSLPLSRFESDLFEVFIWRTFFSKTLNAAAKPALQGSRHRVLTVPRIQMHEAGLDGLTYSSSPSYARIDTTGFDCFVTQTPFPGDVSSATQMVGRYHDAVPVPMPMPHTISDKAFHQASHFHAIKDNVRSEAWFSCISHATRADFLQLFPQAALRSAVIHNIVSDEYFVEDTPAHLVHQIIRNRMAVSDIVKAPKAGMISTDIAGEAAPVVYLLIVSTIEPRNNHQMFVQIWESLKYQSHPSLKLVAVGNVGWDYSTVFDSFRPWAARGEVFWLNNVPSAELHTLYHHAAVTVCPGLAEGFDYSGVEAIKCGCVVAASEIPVHRKIYGDAAVYFDPYDAANATAQLAKLVNPDAAPLREDLKSRGQSISQRYTEAAIIPQWIDFFGHVRGNVYFK